MEPQLQPPSELNARELGTEIPEKEPDYQCGICSKHFLLRSELILHSREDHHHNHHRKSINSNESSNENLQKPTEPFQSETWDHVQDSVDTKLIPNPTQSASSCPKYSHMCPTCYEVFDYRIQLNCHMKVHKNLPEIAPQTEKELQPTGPDPPQLRVIDDPKTKIPQKARGTTKVKPTDMTSEIKFHFCPNSSCNFKSRWRSSLFNHRKTCSQIRPESHSLPNNSATKESPEHISKKSTGLNRKKGSQKFSEKLYSCPNPSCSFKSRWQSSRYHHQKICALKGPKSHRSINLATKKSPRKISKISTKSIKETISYDDSKKLFLCPSSNCNFKSQWQSSLYNHGKTCSQIRPESHPPNKSDTKESSECASKKTTSFKRKKGSYRFSEKLYLCPNPSCSFKTRWPSSRYNHQKTCSRKSPKSSSPNYPEAKEPPKQICKKSTSSARRKTSYKNSEKFYLCLNSTCDFKSRWRSSRWQHQKTCSHNGPNPSLKKIAKTPGRLVAKKSDKLVANKSSKVAAKKNELEPQLVIKSENKELEGSIAAFPPTEVQDLKQHKATHLKYSKPLSCRYPGCRFETRWEGNLRAHIWRRGHESQSETERNHRKESPRNFQSLSKVQAAKIVNKAKKSKDPKSKFKSTNREEISAKFSRSVVQESSIRTTEESSVHIDESSVHIEESSVHIEESSAHIEESSAHIEEFSTHIEDLQNLEDRKVVLQSVIQDPPNPDSPQMAPQSEPNEFSCRIPDCTHECLSASSLRTHYHNMHPTLPLPSICHTSRLRNQSKTDSPHCDRDEDLEKIQPSPSGSSKKQSSKMLKQLFSCPMANCTFTTRWQIDIPKHFDRVHSDPGKSTWRSNRLFEQQQVGEFKQESLNVEGLGSIELDASDELGEAKDSSISSKLETSQVELKVKTEANSRGQVNTRTAIKVDTMGLPEEVKAKVKSSTKVVTAAKGSTKVLKDKVKRSSGKVKIPKTHRDALNEVITDDSEERGSKNRYKCPQCNYRSYTTWHVKRHMVTHGDDRPYPCPGCSMTFRNTGHLKIHQKKYPRCDLAQRRATLNQPNEPSIQPPANKQTPAKALPLQNPGQLPPKETTSKGGCVFCSYLAKLSKFLQKHLRKCPGCHKAVDLPDFKRDKKIPDGSTSVGSAFPCTVCEFIGDSEVSALEHSREHKTALVSLSRVRS